MLDGGFMAAKEVFDRIEGGLGELFKDAETEGLCAGGINAIEDSDCAAAFDPGGTAVRELADAGLGVLGAGKAFCALETS